MRIGLIVILSLVSLNCYAGPVEMYHATHSSNCRKIKKNGLLASQGGCNPHGASWGDRDDMHRCHGKVFLSPSLDHVGRYAKMISDGYSIIPPELGEVAMIFKVIVESSLLLDDPDDPQAKLIEQDIPKENIEPVMKVKRVGGKYRTKTLGESNRNSIVQGTGMQARDDEEPREGQDDAQPSKKHRVTTDH